MKAGCPDPSQHTVNAPIEEQACFRALIEGISDIVSIVDPDGTIRYESPSVESALGYRPEELVGCNAFEFIHPDDVAKIQGIFHGILRQTDCVESGEFRFRHKDGSWRVFEGVGKNLLDDPVVHGVIVNSRDITERKRMDEALCEMQRQQRALLDNIPDIAWIKDKQSRYIAVNEALARACGRKPEEMAGKTDFDFTPRELAERYTADDKQVMESRERRRIEEPFVDAAGNRTFVETIKSAFMNDQGEVVGTTGIARDITDRKRAEESLRASEERYRGLFETMLEGFALCEIICGADGKPCDYRFLEVNSTFEKLLGVTRSQALGKTVREIFPQVEDSWIEIYGKVALTGEPLRFENYLQPLNKYFEVVAFSPKRGQFAAIFQDITERRGAEERIRLQSSALEAAANGIVITDRTGYILWTNPAFTKLTGYTAEEVLGKNPRFLKSGTHNSEFYRDLWQTVISGRVWRGEILNRRKDGRLYNEEMTITPLRDERGEITHFIAIKQDVTSRKQTETSLRESEEMFRSLSASSPLGIFLTDIQGQCTYVNPCCREILGCSLMECQNDGWANLVHPDDRAATLQTWSDYVKSVEGEYSHEYRVQRRDGTIRFVHVRSVLMRSDDGSPMGFVGSIEDITDRKRADDDLRQSNNRLRDALKDLKAAQGRAIQQQRLRALGTMASGIAHDFNNALTAILGFSELLTHRPEYLADKERTLRYLQMINTAAQDAGNVVNRLREFYRQREEGEVFAPVDLNQLVEQAVALTQPKWKNQAEARGLSIHVATELGEVPPVVGNAADLREALTNLILNAVDAMPKGGTITLRTRSDGSRVTLRVADTGMGMTEEVRRRCLEPFFTTKGDHGTGLGLSMVYGILQRHGGTVDIQTTLGKGTTFILSLPSRAEAPAASTADPTPGQIQPLRILLVDDQETVRHILREYLARDGHAVQTADNGREGFEKFQGAEFDVVLLDRAMPGMSGDQVAAAIKQLKPEMPVILLTGFGSMMQAAGETPPGIDLVLGKPVTIAGLRTALAKVVASR
jgi:nitrogen fixation negative regulator NifL